jgi:hypothetical protein
MEGIQMKPAVQIRKAELEDIQALVGLLQELFSIEKDFTPDAAKQRKGLQLMFAKQICDTARIVVDDTSDLPP